MKRWLRFSLRTMLVLITALCIWLGFQVNAARRQREAVTVLRNAGAMIYFDYQVVPESPTTRLTLGGKSIDPDQLPPGPGWLRRLIGDDYFRTVVAVYFDRENASIKKADLDELAKLPHVSLFGFTGSGTDITDKHLIALSQLPRLEMLLVIDARINGSILASLPNPGRLKRLLLYKTEADDATLKHVETMSSLEILLLDQSHVTDAGLVHLRNLNNLENLSLSYTNVTDAG